MIHNHHPAIALALLSILPINAAVTATVVHRFEGAACNPHGNLALAKDGTIYGTTRGPSSSGFNGGGSVFKLSPGGSVTTLAENTSTSPSAPDLRLNSVVLGPDGNLYGLKQDGFFRVTLDGTLTMLHRFDVTLEGVPTSALVLGLDGAFYGGAYRPSFRAPAIIYRLTTAGAYSLVYPSPDILAQNPINIPIGLQLTQAAEQLVFAADGTLYGSSGGIGSPAGATLFALPPGGVPRNLLNTSPTVSENEVVRLYSLMLALDGNLYLTGVYSRSSRNQVVFRVNSAGVATILYSWPSSGLLRAQTIAPLIQGSDGNLYGASIDGGLQGGGFFYRLTAAGEYTTLHTLLPEDGYNVWGKMVQSSDGAFYIPAQQRYVPSAPGGAGCGSILKIDTGLPPTGGPSINSGGVVPLYASRNTIQPGSWVSIFGNNLASSNATWNSDFPTSLGGTSVTINNKPAYLWFVSPTQINLQAPDDTATGLVNVTVTTSAGTATATVTLAPHAPSFSLLDGKHVAGILLRSDGSGAYGGGSYDIVGPTGTSLGYRTVAAKAGDALILFGVGFGPTSPFVPAGQSFTGSAPATSATELRINNQVVQPAFAGLTAAGLYQINLFPIPAGLGTGDVPLTLTIGGVQTPGGVVVSLQ